MTDHESGFYISLDDQREIVRLLRMVPEIVEELTIATTRQSRLGSRGPQVSTGAHRERPLFFDEYVSAVTDDLRGVLVGWARHVLEHRESAYWPEDSMLSLARWLDHNVVALAMTPGAEEMLDELRDAIGRGWRAVDRKPEKSKPLIDEDELAEARVRAAEVRVTAAQVERWAEMLRYKPLKASTVRKWQERKKIEKGADGRYRLGDVLAHQPILETGAN